MKHYKNVAVIGASGMIGSDIIEYLKPNFSRVTGIDRNNYNQYRGQHFDVVINANGNSSKIWAKDHILSDFAASTTSVYQSLFDFPCKTYIYISSADVYRDHTRKKTTSESIPAEIENLSSYGFHKFISEYIIKHFTRNYIILRCPMILGTKLTKGPIYDILHSSRLFIAEKSAFQMITTIELANIISFLIGRNVTKEMFNVGGRGTVLFSKISKYVQQSVSFPQDGETQIYETDVKKLHKVYRLKTSSQYLKDFLKNYKKKDYNPS